MLPKLLQVLFSLIQMLQFDQIPYSVPISSKEINVNMIFQLLKGHEKIAEDAKKISSNTYVGF